MNEIEKRQLQGEIQRLRALCACAYQLAGFHDAPIAWLDMLGDAAAGVPLAQWRQQADPVEVLLPYAPAKQPQGVDVEETLSKAMDMAKCGMGAVNVVDWLTQELIDSQSQQP